MIVLILSYSIRQRTSAIYDRGSFHNTLAFTVLLMQ